MTHIIISLICAIFGLGCGIITAFQFKEKGFVFNNAYLWATKEERAAMDKRPHYRQSAVVFGLMTAFFFLLALRVILDTVWLGVIGWLCILADAVYAVASSIKMEKNSRH